VASLHFIQLIDKNNAFVAHFENENDFIEYWLTDIIKNNPDAIFFVDRCNEFQNIIINAKNKIKNQIKIFSVLHGTHTGGDVFGGPTNGWYKTTMENKDKLDGIIVLTEIQKKDIAVRGELIISKDNWELVKEHGSNARNLVAGLINSKILKKDLLRYIDFVVYEVIDEKNSLKKLKFNVVKHTEVSDLSIDSLYDLYKKWKDESNYEIDGLIIRHNENYKRKEGENPKYSFAFKSLNMHKEVEVIVSDIEWNISKDKYLKPIVKFNEISLNGVKIKQATGFNADFILKNKIGIGSRIIIIRSGDVIPHIKEVLSPATNNKPLMPDVPYIWNKKDIINHQDYISVEIEKIKKRLQLS
jgi:hypothetical protein